MVATEVVGAAVELVRHQVNGLIVSPRSVGSMREALRELTHGDRCAKMRENAPAILAQWRAAADPVEGVRQAWNYFCTSQWHTHQEKKNMNDSPIFKVLS